MGQKNSVFYFAVCEHSGCPVCTIAGLSMFQCFHFTFDVNLSVKCHKCQAALIREFDLKKSKILISFGMINDPTFNRYVL